MAKVKVTLVQAPPEALLSTQIAQLARVTENKSILNLPVSLPFLWVQWMTVRTLHSYVLLIEFFSLRTLLELSAFLAQVLNTIMLLLLVVVRYFTVSTIDTGFSACLQMLP